jgi:ABC-type multidrug transport system ATPase subunit
LHLSARQNLIFSAGMYGVKLSQTNVDELLELVGLNGRGDAKVKTFSQGMKQRLAIACSMAHNPAFILLDEPTNGLDPQGMIDLRELIQRLKIEIGITFLVSSHLLHEIELIADSMMIMHKGKAIITGKANELLTDDQLKVTIETDDAPALMGALLDTKWHASMHCAEKNQLTLRSSREELPSLHKKILETSIPVYQIQSKRKLEDLFLSLTHE